MEHKPIYLDGVDVSGCEFYNKDDKTCREVNGKYDTDICDFDKCEGSNCYYKQLKRAENQIVELNKKVEVKTQEYEELKAYAQRQENQREEYYKEFLRKDKALEKIEEVCLEDTYTFADGTQIRYDSLDDILDIINKAKGNN